jgi:hypothetical protein
MTHPPARAEAGRIAEWRDCTCHPSEKFSPCQERYAFHECAKHLAGKLTTEQCLYLITLDTDPKSLRETRCEVWGDNWTDCFCQYWEVESQLIQMRLAVFSAWKKDDFAFLTTAGSAVRAALKEMK